MILKITFLIFNKANIQFDNKKLLQKLVVDKIFVII